MLERHKVQGTRGQGQGNKEKELELSITEKE